MRTEGEGGGARDTTVQKPDPVTQPAGGNPLLAFLPPPGPPAQALETPRATHPPWTAHPPTSFDEKEKYTSSFFNHLVHEVFLNGFNQVFYM